VTLITVCVPAASEMTIYRRRCRRRSNRRWAASTAAISRVGWTPVQFFFRAIPFAELVAYYAVADVMWITPLRDGLNLVAKEYVAVQGLMQGGGVLVLSEFAGAAAELHGAVLTNPHDRQRPARQSAYYALNIHRAEAEGTAARAVRHRAVQRHACAGVQEFLAAVDATGAIDEPQQPTA
jgi:trehalose-6-phosphate synthase